MSDEPDVVIERRYNGPPDSGHGGYSAGRAAALVEGPAEVTLRRPPPLETPLTVRRDDNGAALLDGEHVVATAAPARIAVESPAPPASIAQAEAASERFAWKRDHPFPTCFGCGPRRDPADALCLFCGPVGDGRFAVPWTPPAWTGDGAVDPVFAWAALDCPSSAPVHGTVSGPVVLGRLAIALEAPIEVGAPHVIQSWLVRSDGRKRETAVALFAEGGERRAAGRAVWIELARPLGA